MEILTVILKMIWLMLPAYLANPAASIAISSTGQGRPIDLGKTIKGKRILGDGKTIKGFSCGVLAGIIVAIIQNQLNIHFFHKSLPLFTSLVFLTLPLGSMSGDLIASFFKRRFGFERGQAFPLVDQLDFVFGAWLLTIIVSPVWFFSNFKLEIIIAALVLTPALHLLVNIIGYKLGISREPW